MSERRSLPRPPGEQRLIDLVEFGVVPSAPAPLRPDATTVAQAHQLLANRRRAREQRRADQEHQEYLDTLRELGAPSPDEFIRSTYGVPDGTDLGLEKW